MLILSQYVLPLFLMVAAISDIRVRRIPNWISTVLVAGFLFAGIIAGLPASVIAMHLGIGLCVLICGFILFAFNVIGGGDAKLLASSAVWMGPTAVLTFLFFTALAGGLFSLAVLMFRQAPLPVIALRIDWVTELHKPGGGIPYGVAIAVGGLSALIMSNSHPYMIY